MHYKEHCHLCENLKTNLQDGITCGLTNQKPEFKGTCSKIQLGSEFEKKIGLIYIEIEKLKKKKTSIYIYSFASMIIGFLLILIQINLLIRFGFTSGIYIKLTTYLLITSFGLRLLWIAYITINEHRKKVKFTKNEKETINSLLKKYQIEYSCNIQFGEKYHGNQEAIVELKSNSNLLKDSKATFKI